MKWQPHEKININQNIDFINKMKVRNCKAITKTDGIQQNVKSYTSVSTLIKCGCTIM